MKTIITIISKRVVAMPDAACIFDSEQQGACSDGTDTQACMYLCCRQSVFFSGQFEEISVHIKLLRRLLGFI